MKEIITMWKYRGDYILGHIFQADMKQYFKQHYDTHNEQMIAVPIPLSNDRLYERGFNQAEMLADFLSVRIENVLTRTMNEKQAKKTRLERIMTVNPFNLVKSLNNPVLLVDDIYTTGRTLRHAAQLLKEAGCQEVYALTLCRG